MDPLKVKFRSIPNTPGVYLFYGSRRELLYVGKATSLKSRVRSYFVGAKSSRPIEQMMHEVKEVSWEQTESVLEAVIVEANYIRKRKPRYNVLGRDDRSWNYITISKDDFPIVSTIRQHELEAIKDPKKKFKHFFGPYPGINTKATMKILRNLFYFSECVKKKRKRPCLYFEMGKCLGVCAGKITPEEYRKKVIRPLVTFLRGKKKQVIKDLERGMKVASKDEAFEEAARLRNQIRALKRIHDVALLNKSFFKNQLSGSRRSELVERIEGYDISNLGKTGKVGSMVVFTYGMPDKKEYRKFKIRAVEGQSDVDCLEEVLLRRLKHNEWRLPDVYLIDGGKPQVNRVKKVLKNVGIHRPVVGIAKGQKRAKNEFIVGSRDANIIKWIESNKSLLIQVRDEAHRFAIAYQRKLRRI